MERGPSQDCLCTNIKSIHRSFIPRIHPPVQDEINIKRSIARRVVAVAQRRVHANNEKKQDFKTHPNPIHNPRVSCPQSDDAATARVLHRVHGVRFTCWAGAGWRRTCGSHMEWTGLDHRLYIEQDAQLLHSAHCHCSCSNNMTSLRMLQSTQQYTDITLLQLQINLHSYNYQTCTLYLFIEIFI